MSTRHQPVLYQETLQALAVRPGGVYVDGTLGGGGHAEGILTASAPDGKLLALDADAAALQRARERLAPFSERATFVHSSFAALGRIARERGFAQVDGIVLDLGLSSDQLADATRGFAFNGDGLDMRFDPTRGEPASALVNALDEHELADLIYEFGEEHASRRIARAMAAARPIESARQLADVIAGALGGRRGKIHPATQTFQALRIAVNDEINALRTVLPQCLELLKPGGRLAVITFHSLEDRIVKNYLRDESRDCLCPPEQPICTCGHRATVLADKSVKALQTEVAKNPRARSARLRTARRLSDTNT
jgi:16S rRNA (cytosine1402-N4)-methyltransferase